MNFMQEYIKLINQSEAEILSDKVLDLKDYFINYGDMNILGAASYIHKNNIELYQQIKSSLNPILHKNFYNIFDRIRSYLELKFKKEFIFDLNLSYPGFHIFYPINEECFMPNTSLHIDTPYELHEEYLLENYKGINFDFPITFTLCLSLPKIGGGLYYWDMDKWETKTLEETEEFYNPIYKKYDDLFINKKPTIEEYKSTLNPKVLEYQSGFINIFQGNLLHQIEPFRIGTQNSESRITLQGHAIESEDKWIIYF